MNSHYAAFHKLNQPVTSRHFCFSAAAQCLCAVADVLALTLSHPMLSSLSRQICTAILCAAVLASAIACCCMQVDVTSAASFSALVRHCFRMRPSLVPTLIAVLSSAACVPLNTSAALLSCSCFCGLCCFLFGLPVAEPPQKDVVTKGG